jgi:hypothetical protein
MSSFDDRKKGFEKKFVHDEEMQFKVNAKRNKYLGEWVAEKLGKKDQNKEIYVQEVIKSDFAEPGDEDVFRKIQKDLKESGIEILDQEIRDQMVSCLERAKKDFL